MTSLLFEATYAGKLRVKNVHELARTYVPYTARAVRQVRDSR